MNSWFILQCLVVLLLVFESVQSAQNKNVFRERAKKYCRKSYCNHNNDS